MSNSLFLGIWKNHQMDSIKLSGFDLSNDVKVLKNEILTRVNDMGPTIELMYRGVLFEDGHSVSFYGVTPGSTVHVLHANPRVKTPTQACAISEEQLEQLAISFRTLQATNSPTSIRNALQRLSKPEILENIAAATPGLSDDHVGMAILQDPELVIETLRQDTIAEVARAHPALIEATYYIAAHMYDERAASSALGSDAAGAGAPLAASGYDYSMEALSDDDNAMEEDDGGSSDTDLLPPSSSLLHRPRSDNVITAAQLAAGIANVTSLMGIDSYRSVAAAGGQVASPPPLITSQAFNDAVHQAFASAGGANVDNVSSSAGRGAAAAAGGGADRWRLQLQQMRDMGLTDDAMNLRVLRATSGDLQAAVEMIFEQTFHGGRDAS